jgi:protein-tyrosine-phosphatase/DNA-binding transcriptional ArsR family regulator
MDDVDVRAARHAALGDPVRLRMVDELALSDRAPVELRQLLGIESNLLAHHLDVLEAVGLITRARSSGDGRRRYVHLRQEVHDTIGVRPVIRPQPALFVCTANSARSQLAAALWRTITATTASSAGTHPAPAVHPGARAAARRARLDLSDATPQRLGSLDNLPGLVVTVCDRAYEELGAPAHWLHWSIPDPVPHRTKAAFDATVTELADRIRTVTATAA